MAKHLDHPSSTARKALAARFALPYSDEMQDWEWEVADPARFSEFLSAYTSGELDKDQAVSLMEIMVQSTEGAEVDERLESFWTALEPLLRAGRVLHAETIEYWAQPLEDSPESEFKLSGKMRVLLNTK
jgi:hypothetical protein